MSEVNYFKVLLLFVKTKKLKTRENNIIFLHIYMWRGIMYFINHFDLQNT
jgi:hypothetical protein